MAVADMIVQLQQGFGDPDKVSFIWEEIRQLEYDRPDPGAAISQRSAPELIRHAEQVLDRYKQFTRQGIRQRLEAIQLLDQWYAPLNGARLEDRAIEHVDDYVRLLDVGRLNEEEALGSVIPKQPRWGLHSAEGELDAAREEAGGQCCRAPDLVNAILNQVAVLPPKLRADDPDGGLDGKREIAVRYRVFDGFGRKPLPVDDREIKVAFAPLTESATEITVNFPGEHEGRRWYDVIPDDFGERIRKVFREMCAEGAHIVVFPECTIRQDLLPDLRAAVRAQAKDSSIVLVVAGISSPVDNKGHYSRNHVVVLDERGNIVLSHDKLMRWNLKKWERDNYGLVCRGVSDDERVYENILPGEELQIVELPGLARMVVLICADMNAGEPGDWLRRNMQLDWTFAPLLDSETQLARWIGKDSERAARIARSRVVVINSMSLQQRYLATKRQMDAESGVALFMDGREAPLRYTETRLPLDGLPGKWQTRNWDRADWKPVPPPWHEGWFRVPPTPGSVPCQTCRWFAGGSATPEC
jgi:predicted amidohydrolase